MFSLIMFHFSLLFFKGRRNLQDGSVQYILDTVMDELGKNPDRKFIYVEMAFFYRWWNEQTDEMKDKVCPSAFIIIRFL